MEPATLLFSALAVLVVGAVWVLDRRLQKVEAALDRLDELDTLGARIGALAAELDRKEASSQVQAKLTEVAEAERRLVAALGDVTRQVAELRRTTERQGRLTPAAPPPDLADVVQAHLAAEGFERVQVLTELSRIEGRSGRVAFEARKGGVMHKGHASVEEGRVVEENLQSAYSAFP